jgi:hypothetical protein
MGFVEKKGAPFNTRGNKTFYHPKKKIWISADEDCHNGGVWKLFKGDRREGTYNIDLTQRIKD